MSKKNKICIKRLISDINEISKEYMPNIHIWYDENKITSIKALIIGPDDTPYQDGFYFFSIEIPKTYPFESPSAKFETINDNIRFNPNLYERGKVCLSILGTWSGPKWTSVQTLKSLLLSIQSLLDENPINNEPGFDKVSKDDKRALSYNEYIRYHNYNFAIYNMLVNNKFPYFNDVIEKYFVENYEKLKNELIKYQCLDNNNYKTFIWCHSVKVNYTELLEKYEILYKKLEKKDFSHVKNTSVHTN